MDILFRDSKQRELFNSGKALVRKYGPLQAKKLRQRLDELRAAPTLEVMTKLPGRCHELKGDRKGELSLDLVHPQRLIFVPEGDPPRKPDGGLDWTSVRTVRIVGLEDTHE